jgi:hypothetical protein
MKYASFPHPILPTVQGDPDYQTIHAIRKLLHTNMREIDKQLGGGTLGHLSLIVYDAGYAIIAPTGENGPIIWTNPTAPGRAPAVLDQGTAAQLRAGSHSWEEAVLTYRTFNTVQKGLKKKIITVFEPMYVAILNDDMVCFAKVTAREMLDHLFFTYDNITAIDLEFFMSICARLGTPLSQWIPYSSKFKIVMTSRRQEEYLLDIHSKSM